MKKEYLDKIIKESVDDFMSKLFGNEVNFKKSLDLSNKNLKSIPPKTFNSDLQTLDLSNNELNMIPEQIKHLKDLYFLDLSKNPLVGLKSIENLKYCKKLKEVRLKDTQIYGSKDVKEWKEKYLPNCIFTY
jgi:hypothetical protein